MMRFWLASFNRNGTDDREQDDSDWEPDAGDEPDFDGEMCMPEWDGKEIDYTKSNVIMPANN